MKMRSWLLVPLLGCLCVCGDVRAQSKRAVTPEAEIFQRLRNSVFTIFGDEGHGSGFLVDSTGLVLTNEHVVANSSHVRVQIDDSTKVAAKIVRSEKEIDLAVLMINPRVVRGIAIPPIRRASTDLGFEGERVLAIGSPLNQVKIVSSGIISKVEDKAVFTDVNMNPGNSGGPLINLDGEVIGVNTFRDVGKSGGAGIAGSLPISMAIPIIDAAVREVRNADPPSSELLPVLPKDSYPLWGLDLFTRESHMPSNDKSKDMIYGDEKQRKSPFKIDQWRDTGGFEVSVQTPVSIYQARKKFEMALGKKRLEREREGGVAGVESFDPYTNLRGWAQYVGENAPAVVINLSPKIGGFGSFEYKADLADFQLYVDGTPRPEILREMQFVSFSLGAGGDVARAGRFAYAVDLFGPANGRWPKISLEITMVNRPVPMRIELPDETVEQIWADFEPYREQVVADHTARSFPEGDVR